MSRENITGRAVILPDYISSETIIKDEFVEIEDQMILGDRCFQAISEDFSAYFPPNGIIVAGKNFGYGSNRDYPIIALINMGVKLVIAESFDRLFYRNAINLGLIVVEAPGCLSKIKKRDNITVDFEKNIIINNTENTQFECNKIFIIENNPLERKLSDLT